MKEGLPCHEAYTYEKFILYLYLCAAYSDYKIDEDEVDLIKEKMKNKNLIKPEDFDRNWSRVWHDFRSHNDIDTIEHVEDCANHLHLDKNARIKIYKDIEDIIMVDGREEDSERINLFKFKKLLGV